MKRSNSLFPVIFIALLLCQVAVACPDKDTLCGSCSGSNCTYCYAGCVGKDGVCKMPPTPIENCLTYSDDKTCIQCVFGYSLKKNICQPVSVEKCVRTAKTGSECLVCDAGILAEKGVCKAENKCSIENCRFCAKEEGSELCVLCSAGYSLLVTESGVVCKPEAKGPSNCLALDQNDPSRCSFCRAGYYVNKEKCTESEDYEINQESAMLLSLTTLILALFV